MCSKRNKRFTVQIIIAEECEHYAWICTPPNWTAHIDGIILGNIINFSFICREFFVLSFLCSKINEVVVRHVIILVSNNFKLVGTCKCADCISHALCVSNLYISYVIVFTRMRKKYYERFCIFIHIITF